MNNESKIHLLQFAENISDYFQDEDTKDWIMEQAIDYVKEYTDEK